MPRMRPREPPEVAVQDPPHLYSRYKMVKFSQKFQELFLLLILSCGVNMKSFASFKRKLWAI